MDTWFLFAKRHLDVDIPWKIYLKVTLSNVKNGLASEWYSQWRKLFPLKDLGFSSQGEPPQLGQPRGRETMRGQA